MAPDEAYCSLDNLPGVLRCGGLGDRSARGAGGTGGGESTNREPRAPNVFPFADQTLFRLGEVLSKILYAIGNAGG